VTPSPLSNEQLSALAELLPGKSSDACGSQVMAGLARYVDELYRGNPRFGLIAKDDAADRSRLFSRHILDCLAVTPILAEILAAGPRRRVYDLGSGAGLPGIPVALALAVGAGEAMPLETVLVERRTKRVNFLRGVVPLVLNAFTAGGGTCAPPAIRVAAVDADDLVGTEATGLQESLVVFRAYQQTSAALLASLARTFPPGTPVCALKGRSAHVEMERQLITDSQYTDPVSTRVHLLRVPGGVERSALVWRTADDSARRREE
jgi:16S rRNA (guanine527-N7)-methyltransferase